MQDKQDSMNQDYTAITRCSSDKFKKIHYIKATISSDQSFEDKLDQLMSCENFQSDIEYV